MMDEISNHVGFEQLADYAEERLAAADLSVAADHLSACVSCQADLRWLLATTAAFGPATWQAPPLAARARVRRAFREGHRQPQPKFDFVALFQRALSTLRGGLAGESLRPAFVAAATALVMLVVIFSLRGRQPVAPAHAAVTSLVSGDVQIKAAESESWKPVIAQAASPAEPLYLYSGDQIFTASGSSLQVAFFDHSVTLLDESTELAVRQLEQHASEYEVALFQRRGRTAVSVQPGPGDSVDFQIETPVALVRVTGTRFEVTVGEDGTTEVAVQEGTVVVSSGSASTEVHQGEVVVVRPGAAPATVVPTAIPLNVAPTRAATPAPPSNRPSAKDKEKKEGPAAAPQSGSTPGTRQDGERAQPTRKAMPEQAQPHPTKKPLPTHVPPPAQGSPPGQEKRPNLDRQPEPAQRP
ncbi:MAG: FecR domain-containing protein [Anaerolineae bacterium]|nr:FecR domain-containing protein [Anaerolineae bacterium]